MARHQLSTYLLGMGEEGVTGRGNLNTVSDSIIYMYGSTTLAVISSDSSSSSLDISRTR